MDIEIIYNFPEKKPDWAVKNNNPGDMRYKPDILVHNPVE